jgi:hypothetical protein
MAPNNSTRLYVQAPQSKVRASSDQITMKQGEILDQLRQGNKEPASGESSRRGLITGTMTATAGGCMCGICGASPVQAAAPGDWGYSTTLLLRLIRGKRSTRAA